MLQRLTAEVVGRVQGVGFRFFVQHAANRLKLSGYVRNLPDGRRVEVEVEGPRPALEALLDELREGPPGAHVEHVQHSWQPATGAFRGFEIIN